MDGDGVDFGLILTQGGVVIITVTAWYLVITYKMPRYATPRLLL